MRGGAQTQAGLTLIEILVALALLGVVMQAVLSVQASTIKASRDLVGTAQRLEDLRAVSAYFTGRLRSASDFKDSVTVDGATCALSDAVRPCFALKVSEIVNPAAGQVDTYFMTYQLLPRGEVRPADPAATVTNPLAQDLRLDSWASTASNQIYVLVERRWQLAAGQAGQLLPTTWTSSDPTFASASAAILADDLSPFDQSVTPNVLKFLTYDNATKRFDLFLRLRRQEGDGSRTLPADGSFMTSTVYRRN